MSCDRVGELLSDDLEGTLDPIFAAEVGAHLATCEECRALRTAMAEVTAFLRLPEVVPAADLAFRVARASFMAAPPPIAKAGRTRAWADMIADGVGWLTDVPFAVQAVAAAFALVVTAGLVTAAGAVPDAGGRPRIAQRLSDATVYVVEKKERLIEDVRLLRVVIGTAFEGRLDRVNDRVEDYRRLLERRRRDEQAKEDSKPRSERSEPAPAPPRRTV
jgi:anti-sigma factor RsiW